MSFPTAKEKLLTAALTLIRQRGFSATTVDALCEHAGVTKGAFFHHFASKDSIGAAAADFWSTVTGELFENADYHQVADPVDRVFAYVALRKELVEGELDEFTCVAGTMLQEVHQSSPAIRGACAQSILDHAATLETDFAEALEAVGRAEPSAASLAVHTQTVIQGAFIMAKATGDPDTAREAIDHLDRYLRFILQRLDTQRTEP